VRRLMAIALVALGLLVSTGTAHAANGWMRYKGTWIEYHYSTKTTFENPRVVQLVLDNRRARAIKRARSTRTERLRKLLRTSQAILDRARATIYGGNTSGFPASCVAMAEEGGHNSVAGYFGFIYPPSSYGASGYGESWLNWPWSAQVQVALGLYHRYGGSAWGSLTRQKCGI
jgi:hypothetical protein